jgi:hypothetical protein
MTMNTSFARIEALRETAYIQERRDNAWADTGLQEIGSDEQTPPRNLAGPFGRDEGAFETFVGGAGI